jgi:hypothetical protein
MLNLEPLIARLVDDVLGAIRTATLAELRAVLASSELDLERKPRLAAPSPVARPPEVKRVPASRRKPPSAPASLGVQRSHPEPEPHSEITDPERLLAPPVPPPPRVDTAPQDEPVVAAPEEAPPESRASTPVVHAVGHAPARLRVGESLANTTGTGVVIRRAKKT